MFVISQLSKKKTKYNVFHHVDAQIYYSSITAIIWANMNILRYKVLYAAKKPTRYVVLHCYLLKNNLCVAVCP